MSSWGNKSLTNVRDNVYGRSAPEFWEQSSVSYRDKVTSTARLFSCGGLRYWELLGASRAEIRLIQPLAYHYLALCAQARRLETADGSWKKEIETFFKSYGVYDTDVQKGLYDLEHAHTLTASLRAGLVEPTESLLTELARLGAGELLALVKVISTLCGRPLSTFALGAYEAAVRLAQLDGDLVDYAQDVRAGRYNHYHALLAIAGAQQVGARMREQRQDLLTEAENRLRGGRFGLRGHRELRTWLARRQELPALPQPISAVVPA
ncbi:MULTISPECIES: hypothetical protein [unclassified Crossiella]|uniref:hypothetical protein n=1 Tax=unclassified Crossiella TaxID=2620835 RepID=UPI0020003531|nr:MULTISPECIES: hypothetical protein [unclassified Crossiella]MCK2240127.1 hypothetical protein [Crossiella sp. S99.2]MCK2253421.1 hypothetical protein [Crossiella sp. S99.1]